MEITEKEIIALIGKEKTKIWKEFCEKIEQNYEMDKTWNSGGKKWTYEYKYRKGGKTLCAFYMRENTLGLMIILGKEERKKWEENRNNFSKEIQEIYDNTKTYHDGKWMMIELENTQLLEEIEKILCMKRKPNIR